MYLAPNVFLVEVDDRGVVLDLVRDKYLALEGGLLAAALALTGAAGAHADLSPKTLEAAKAKLLAQGFITERPLAPPPRQARALAGSAWPSSAEGAEAPPRPDLRTNLSALAALGQTARSLRRRPFHHTIAWLQRSHACGARSPRVSSQTALDAFRQMRPLFPVAPICRLDALALALHLWRSGHDADLVFGVRLGPFAAHCWVQIDDCVLKEAHDVVRQYTPIMVV